MDDDRKREIEARAAAMLRTMKNMGMPGSIEDEVTEQIEAAVATYRR